MSDQTMSIDFDAMTRQLEAMNEEIRKASRALEEVKRQQVADRVLALEDGFWLVQARNIMARMRDDPNVNIAYGYQSGNFWNMVGDMDRLIQFVDQMNRDKAAKP